MDSNDFTDYYDYLQVSPNADLETIEKVFRLLAKKYHPDNGKTGDFEKFNALLEAHRVLSDPASRAKYDLRFEEIQRRKWRLHSVLSDGDSPDNGEKIRQDILLAVYAMRKQNPQKPGIGIWNLEKLLGYPEKLMEFEIWYLKEKGWIARTDSGKYAITVDGVDIIEQSGTVKEKLKLLPYSRLSS